MVNDIDLPIFVGIFSLLVTVTDPGFCHGGMGKNQVMILKIMLLHDFEPWAYSLESDVGEFRANEPVFVK